MIMDKDYRKRLQDVRNEEAEREFASSVEGAAGYAHPADPKHAEMKEASQKMSGLNLARVQADGSADSGAKPAKRGPGRPKGS